MEWKECIQMVLRKNSNAERSSENAIRAKKIQCYNFLFTSGIEESLAPILLVPEKKSKPLVVNESVSCKLTSVNEPYRRLCHRSGKKKVNYGGEKSR